MRLDRLVLPAFAVALAACHPAQPHAATPPPAPRRVKLAVLPAESHEFPKTAKVVTEALAGAKVSGVDDKQVSQVSLEATQLLVECNDPTPDCYQAVGKSLSADRLLFAQIVAMAKKHVKVTVTLFNVGAQRTDSHAEKEFANEGEAKAGVADLVAEATR